MNPEHKSRMISFRLTEDEYDRCRQLCFTQGLRSVSEMARAGIHLLLQQPDKAPHEALENRVSELEGRIHILGLELKKMMQSATLSALPAVSVPESRIE